MTKDPADDPEVRLTIIDTRSANSNTQVPRLNFHDLNNSFNTYATRKTYATGLFDLALIATNFGQLKQLLQSTSTKWTNLDIVLLSFICLSLIFQFIIGVLLIYLARQNEFLNDAKRQTLVRFNNFSTVLILAVTIINLFLSVFVTVK